MTAPAAFFAHGAPLSALGGDDHASAIRAFGDAWRSLAGIVIVSAHWHKPMPVSVTSWESAPVLHDFSGFPEELYRLEYPAHGDADIATRIDLYLHAAGIRSALDPSRGLDHGAWVPLRLAWPDAAIPVIALSLPMSLPRQLFALGEALRPLRQDGVLIAASGGIVHNLSRIDIRKKDAPPAPWAQAFDQWVARALESRNHQSLFNYRTQAPHAAEAVPTTEHFDPLFVALGAADPDASPTTIYEGFHYSTLSMRSFSF